jgi:hypothetical protein
MAQIPSKCLAIHVAMSQKRQMLRKEGCYPGPILSKKLRDRKFISQSLTAFQAKSTNHRQENRA